MHLRSLYLHDFRVYREARFAFDPGFNVIYGPNAQGKTSLLEAIYFLIAAQSFRTASTNELVRNGASKFYLEALLTKHTIEQSLRISCGSAERKFIHNSTAYASSAPILGVMQGIIASPDDIMLVKGPPALRRQYLDRQIAQVDPLYVHHLNRYNRALKQRNCLLRAKQILTIESWEHEMALSAAYLTMQRINTVVDIDRSLQTIHQRLTRTLEVVSIEYKSSAEGVTDRAAYFLSQYRKSRQRELEIGATLYGPHKDDLVITVNGYDIRSFASEGQQRTCVLALRCAEWERVHALGDAQPIMLVDDLGIGLDAERIQLLLIYLSGLFQVFVTTTNPKIMNFLTDRPLSYLPIGSQ